MKKRRNPLRRRLLRELKSDIGRYIVIFFLLIVTIGICSGFNIADKSMIKAYEESYEKYNREDGNFKVKTELTASQRKEIESLGVVLYDLKYSMLEADNGSNIRVYENRTEIDKACLMKGNLPEATGEIAVDRMWAENQKLSVGDSFNLADGREYKICGFIALPDYTALFADNSDTMFDAKTFCVALVSHEEFESIDTNTIEYSYGWKYNHKPVDDYEADKMSEDFREDLHDIVSLSSYVPAYKNQAIVFTAEDMGKDGAMMQVLCYFLIAIMAFVFAITSKHTIVKEANVIGTLRASGYTRGELIVHYLTLPVVVTLISALVGNILGYTLFKDYLAGLYYGSYSLPTYTTVWNADAFVQTTIIPLILMAVINLFVLFVNIRKPVLKFLRGDLSNQKNKKALRLSTKIKIFRRFQIRVLLRNIPSYMLIFVGAFFCNVLLMFGLSLPNVLDNYTKALPDDMLAKYIYMLEIPEDTDIESMEPMELLALAEAVKTDNKDAEKFSAYVLRSYGDVPIEEDITCYGVEEDSKYVNIKHYRDGVSISSAMAEKYGLSRGDNISLKEKYSNTSYDFLIKDIYSYDTGIALFMDIDYLNEIFDLDEDTFVGYFSDSEIDDIDENYIGSVMDFDTLNKISEQLDLSMGKMMYVVDIAAMFIFMMVVYLLAKIIIEKDAHSISVIKILGYSKGEVGRLYIGPMSIAVVICFVGSIPLVYQFIVVVFRVMLSEMMAGWMPINISNSIFLIMIVMGIGTYAVVAFLEYFKVSKVSLDIALKTIE